MRNPKLLPFLFLILFTIPAISPVARASEDGESGDGEQFEAALVRISDLEASAQAGFPSFGADSLLLGTVEVDADDNEVEVELKGALADSTYTVTFCPFVTGTADCLAIGSFSTDGQGNGEGEFNFPQLGTFAGVFVLKRDDLNQFASGFLLAANDSSDEDVFESNLQLVGAVSGGLGPGFTPLGEDPLGEGEVEVERNQEVEVEVQGAAANAMYTVHFCRFGLGPSGCVMVGSFTTDDQGDAEEDFEFPLSGSFAGVFVLRGNMGQDVNQFVSGFQSNPSLGPAAADADEFELQLVRISDLATGLQDLFSPTGTDPLLRGELEVESEDDEVEVEVEGAQADATYTVTFCSFATGTTDCSAIGSFTTDALGNAEAEFNFPESGIFAGTFVLSQDGLSQFVSGFILPTTTSGNSDDDEDVFESNLHQVAGVSGVLGPDFTPLGDDPLGEGEVEVERNQEVEVEVRGAAANAMYTVHFCPFGLGPTDCVMLGSFTTDDEGNAEDEFTFPSPGTFAGVFVLRRDISGEAVNQFVTGFQVTMSNGVVNAASFTAGTAVAPGSIVSVFGTNLASTTRGADLLPLPTSLDGATVQFNSNVAAPLFFTSPLQANVQVPYELAGQAEASVTVTVDGLTSKAKTVSLAPFSPAIFTLNQQGTGQGAIVIADTGGTFAAPEGAIPGLTSRPVRRGEEFVVIFCTGLGPVTNQPPTGSPALISPLSETTEVPAVTIGGVPATVTFSGLAPLFVSLYQVNVRVPANAPTGDGVPVVLTIGGVTSNAVSIAVE